MDMHNNKDAKTSGDMHRMLRISKFEILFYFGFDVAEGARTQIVFSNYHPPLHPSHPSSPPISSILSWHLTIIF